MAEQKSIRTDAEESLLRMWRILGTAYLIPTKTFCREAADVLVITLLNKMNFCHQ